jgi:glycosyltransferase involved in cell wall biosynthesis
VKVVHVLLAGATRYDQNCARSDFMSTAIRSGRLFEQTSRGWLREGQPSSIDDLLNLLRSTDQDLLHVHGSAEPPKRLLAGLQIPWICDRRLPKPRALFRRLPSPAVVLVEAGVPEAAGEEWFIEGRRKHGDGRRRRVGTYARTDAVKNHAEQAAGRIQRFREDVDWVMYERPPSPEELVELDLWVDPASGDGDLDGMVVEAVVSLTPVVAARTAVNSRRLDGGKAGLLTPIGDHNELTHAVLNVLFKSEVSTPLRQHAEAIRDRHRPERRRAALERIYKEVIG